MDFKGNKQYLIPSMVSGEELDLNSIAPKVIFEPNEIKDVNIDPYAERFMPQRLPFSLAELPYEKLQYVKDSKAIRKAGQKDNR